MGMEVDIALLGPAYRWAPAYPVFWCHIFRQCLYLVASFNSYHAFTLSHIACSRLWVLNRPCQSLSTEDTVNYSEPTAGIEQDTLR